MGERFEGYPEAGLRFLRGLARHNDRDWFEERRATYRDDVRLPTLRLAGTINERLENAAPHYVTRPTRAVPRLARDRRFHPERPPYKTFAAALFGYGGRRLFDGCGFAVRVSPSGVTIGGGAFRPRTEQVRRVREAIARDRKGFDQLVSRRALRQRMGELRGARAIRVSPDFGRDHPAGELLRLRQYYFEVEHGLELARSRDLVTETLKCVRVLRPFVDWLAGTLRLEAPV